MVQIGRRRLFAPMAIPAMALLQQYDARRDILNELVARWRAAIESVTVVYYGQMVGWIKMKLGVQVGLGPGDFVLGGYPAPRPQKGAEPPNSPSMYIVAKRLDGSRWHLAWRWASVQATLW